MNTTKRIAVIGLIVALGIGAAVALRISHHKESAAPAAHHDKYQCSMHPQIVRDEPGNCPICGMTLTKVLETPAAAPKEHKILFYSNPMDPTVTSPVPAKDSMGMDYVPVYEDEMNGTGASAVPGHASFSLSGERQQLIGVKTMRVTRAPLNLEIRAVGKVAFDPELYNALGEYREALSAQQKMSDSAAPESRERVNALGTSAALRLRLMGISDAQTRSMLKDNTDTTNLLLPGKKVWIYAQVYEYEADSVKKGQPVIVTLPSAPGQIYRGRVAAVDPVLDPVSRTVRVRAEIETPQGKLKPESFVQVKIQIPLGNLLAVPEDAVLDTGERQIIFVKKGEGQFEPRAVILGRQAQDQYEILSGIEEGEEVVTSANFLIDSESRFRAAVEDFAKEKKQ